jgi:hypothetical protein
VRRRWDAFGGRWLRARAVALPAGAAAAHLLWSPARGRPRRSASRVAVRTSLSTARGIRGARASASGGKGRRGGADGTTRAKAHLAAPRRARGGRRGHGRAWRGQLLGHRHFDVNLRGRCVKRMLQESVSRPMSPRTAQGAQAVRRTQHAPGVRRSRASLLAVGASGSARQALAAAVGRRVAFAPAATRCATSASANVTNPKPRGRPVALSAMRKQSVRFP